MRPSVDGSRSTIHCAGQPGPLAQERASPQVLVGPEPVRRRGRRPAPGPRGVARATDPSSDHARSSSTVHHPRPTSSSGSGGVRRRRRLLAVGHGLQHEAAGGARVVARSLADPWPDLQLGAAQAQPPRAGHQAAGPARDGKTARQLARDGRRVLRLPGEPSPERHPSSMSGDSPRDTNPRRVYSRRAGSLSEKTPR